MFTTDAIILHHKSFTIIGDPSAVPTITSTGTAPLFTFSSSRGYDSFSFSAQHVIFYKCPTVVDVQSNSTKVSAYIIS